jgi:hypothetical protein
LRRRTGVLRATSRVVGDAQRPDGYPREVLAIVVDRVPGAGPDALRHVRVRPDRGHGVRIRDMRPSLRSRSRWGLNSRRTARCRRPFVRAVRVEKDRLNLNRPFVATIVLRTHPIPARPPCEPKSARPRPADGARDVLVSIRAGHARSEPDCRHVDEPQARTCPGRTGRATKNRARALPPATCSRVALG